MMQRLRLLCTSGAGLQAISSAFCAAVCGLIGADAAMIMWFTERGEPLGFFHSNAPAELKDYFVANLDALFNDAEEVSARFLAAPEGPLIGKMMDPGLQDKFHRGKIYRHLCIPLGHYHMLDMRAHVPGTGLAGFFAWNPPENPFGQTHVDLLDQVQPLMQQALAAPEAKAQWRSVSSGTPHLITDLTGRNLLVIDAEAEQVLMSSHLLRQNLSLIRQPRQAPGFVAMLAAMLDGQHSAELCLPVADGRLVCRATRTRLLQGSASDSGSDTGQMFVSLDRQAALEVDLVNYVMGLSLTRIQCEIAFFALTGGERGESLAVFGVSQEALKKHLRAIFLAAGVANWAELQSIRDHAPAWPSASPLLTPA